MKENAPLFNLLRIVTMRLDFTKVILFDVSIRTH